MRSLLFALLTVFVTLFASLAFASELRVVTSLIPPFTLEKAGISDGMITEIFETVMERAGTPVERSAIRIFPWPRAYYEARTKPGTILLCIAKTEGRKDQFKWVGPIYRIQLCLVGRGGKEYRIDQLSDATPYTIVVLRNSAPAQYLHSKGYPFDNVVNVSEASQAFQMLQKGRADLFAHVVEYSHFLTPELGLNPYDYKIVHVYGEVDLYMGLNRSFSDDTVAKMQAAFESIKREGAEGKSLYDEILGRYVK